MTDWRCAALLRTGQRCASKAVASNDYWRCARHTDWYEHATLADRERLALMELSEYDQDTEEPET